MASSTDTTAAIPPPDAAAAPEGYVVVVEPADRIHFLDWGATDNVEPGAPGALLIHGLAGTSWVWTPVARRLRHIRRTVAMDLRGHGLSDAPTSGYELSTLVSDVVAVADGTGLLAGGFVLAGHGFGAIVATAAAVELGVACRGLVLVDGGWEDLRASTGQEPDEFLRTLDEPPEVLRSMRAFLADRRGFDPATWDPDQEHAARATVVETQAGKVVSVTRPHVVEAVVATMFAFAPLDTLAAVDCPIVALAAMDNEDGGRMAALDLVQAGLAAIGRPSMAVRQFPDEGHNLMRYRPNEVTAAILDVADGAATRLSPIRPG